MLGTKIIEWLSGRGPMILLGRSLAAFGLQSALIQLLAIWLPKTAFTHAPLYMSLIAAVSLTYGVIASWPPSRVFHLYKRPTVKIAVEVGDHFSYSDHHLVVGFTDTFDTDTTDDVIIHSGSVQGRFLKEYYRNNRESLDHDLEVALASINPEMTESPDAKRGKLNRYPIGTVAVLGIPTRRIFCLAYGVLGNDLIVRSDIEYIWAGLNSLWDAVAQHSQHGKLAMPVIGSNFARMTNLDHQALIKIIIISYIARCRRQPISSQLTVTIWPPDAGMVDMLDIHYFLKSM